MLSLLAQELPAKLLPQPLLVLQLLGWAGSLRSVGPTSSNEQMAAALSKLPARSLFPPDGETAGECEGEDVELMLSSSRACKLSYKSRSRRMFFRRSSSNSRSSDALV